MCLVHLEQPLYHCMSHFHSWPFLQFEFLSFSLTLAICFICCEQSDKAIGVENYWRFGFLTYVMCKYQEGREQLGGYFHVLVRYKHHHLVAMFFRLASLFLEPIYGNDVSCNFGWVCSLYPLILSFFLSCFKFGSKLSDGEGGCFHYAMKKIFFKRIM
jgi:hypothetical protein